MFRSLLLGLGGLLSGSATAVDLPHVNWENHPVHALDLSPDGRLLAAAHTADHRVQLFDVSSGEAVAVGHVVVGLDPVSVRFRSAAEMWVVNHISDSVSIIDVAQRRVRATLATDDEPFDVVFAQDRAFVSCSQANRVLVFDLADLNRAPLSVAIDAEDPRALAVSRDGRTVIAAIFESGNATTLLAGGLLNSTPGLPNVVSDPRGPYAGQNPPPNKGASFEPPLNPAASPPRVGLIVRKGADGRWRDDNIGDWTELVSGAQAASSGRRVGWDMPDRDLALIDTQTLAVRYVSGLMNIGMAVAVDPAGGEIELVGTDALNEQRFEPNVNGRFLRVQLARVSADGAAKALYDLNAQLDYRQPRIAATQRARAVGDPRAVVVSADGTKRWVAGMGSNNVVAVDASGRRIGTPIAVGEGPAGLALDEGRDRLYVWNHFEVSLSTIDLRGNVESARLAAFNPLPLAIRDGRALLYDTHRTSGLGHVACGSCHVDGRMDRLAWDLGDPTAAPQRFDQNCITTIGVIPCRDFHAMKGPMTTQTLQDIIGHEPFHWRGDRAGIEAFNPAFEGLLGDDVQLTASEMQAFEDMLATITYPPNPFRNFNNSLPTAVPLDGHYTSGRFSMPGLPLGVGDALQGLRLYANGLLDPPFQCASCHTLPTGMASNGPLLLGLIPFAAGGSVMAMGPLGENHLGIVSVDGSTNVSIKVPHLRNQYDKVGFDMGQAQSRAGFGFLHDGSVDSLSRFVSARGFVVRSDQDVADLVALMLAFSGSDFGDANPALGAPAPRSRDSHAAAGRQLTLRGGSPPERVGEMLDLARRGAVDLVVREAGIGHAFDAASGRFLGADDSSPITPQALLAAAAVDRPQTWTVVPAGLGKRLGIDRDGDGVADARELTQGSNPADAASKTLRPTVGLWGDASRPGQGFDLQFVDAAMVLIWYTYRDDGSPIWYLASAPTASSWRADLFELNRLTNGSVETRRVGGLVIDFAHARSGRLIWTLGTRSGTQQLAPLLAPATTLAERSGLWTDPAEPGWGLGVNSVGDLRSAVVYFYDAANQPIWVFGVGENRPSERLPLQHFRGYCPDCAVRDIEVGPAGELEWQFAGNRNARLTTRIATGGSRPANWARAALGIRPVSLPVLHAEGF